MWLITLALQVWGDGGAPFGVRLVGRCSSAGSVSSVSVGSFCGIAVVPW